MTDIEAVHNAQVVEEAQLATAPPSGGNPVPLGLLVFALGSTVLGISLLGYVPLAVQGNTIMPIVFAATGLGLLITTTWAVRIGETFVATVLGAFAAFWISYAALVIGLAHNWYAIPPTAILHTIGEFLIAWDIVIFMLFLVSLRIPLLFSLDPGRRRGRGHADHHRRAGVIRGHPARGRGVRAGVRSPGVLRLPRHGHRVGWRQAVAVRQASPEFAGRK